MTILNTASDGHYPELIVLFRAVAQQGTIEQGELIRICAAGSSPRVRPALSRWTELGLFVSSDTLISLPKEFAKKRGESLDSATARLPSLCRRLILDAKHCLPLWGSDTTSEDGTGRAADFARGISWALSQDIYRLHAASPETIEAEDKRQLTGGKAIFQNKTRWPGLRFWARYLGFATGDDSSFLLDPTSAVREELPSVFSNGSMLPAMELVKELGSRLPVLDFGAYRTEVERHLNDGEWSRPADGHLSMSLSLALRRLEFDKTLSLEIKADAGDGLALTGAGSRTIGRFTHARLGVAG